jgi:predicted nuclease of restriction endonuclease-like (RecB) superfamily
MVIAYWEIGKRIVENEQAGEAKAVYGQGLLKELSQNLTADFGKGFDQSNLRYMRLFYQVFPIRDALRHELGWTHYRLLLKVENEKRRSYYLHEAIAQNWSTRALERQINSFYYERILSSKQRKEVTAEAKNATDALAARPEDFIKDPYVLEFLHLSTDNRFLEKDLENAIINNLQQFILELGKGYAFVAQQKHIRAGDDFYIDLVFYNYILKCFVLVDLKLGKLTHQDIGQMDTYVRWYEENEKGTGDNPTLGIILCSEKAETIVKYSVLKDSKQLFASKYKLYLPTEKELIKEVEQGLLQYKLQHGG